MSTQKNRELATQFAPEVQFEVTPMSEAEARLRMRDRFEELQGRLVEQYLHQPDNSLVRAKLELIANDAAALAWTTPYPLLLMPVLFQEKAREGRAREARQQRIQKRSRALMESECLVEKSGCK